MWISKPLLYILTTIPYTHEESMKYQRLRGADIHRLSIFKAVVESGGLSSAADYIDVDLSTISRHIKDLEIRLGITLCNRGPSGFSLTPHGEVAYNASCLLNETLNTCDEMLEGLREDLSGTLRVGVVNHILLSKELGFPDIVKETKKKAPNLSIECKVLTPHEIMSQIENRQLHLGILSTNEKPNTLSFTKIFHEDSGLYCAKGHQLYDHDGEVFGQEDLNSFLYASRNHSSPTDIRAQELGLVAGTSSNSIDVILSMILSGLYLGFIPSGVAKPLENDKKIKRLPLHNGECLVPFYSCTLIRDHQSKRTEFFSNIIKNIFLG